MPDDGVLLETLGIAQYRCGLTEEALATLTRSVDLNQGAYPTGLAFLALTQHRLGHPEEARNALGRLRDVMKSPQWSGEPQFQAVLREAKSIELDLTFPVDPFAH